MEICMHATSDDAEVHHRSGCAIAPVFVLTAARSGSTLLRFMLDTHPELACPPELGVAAACAQLARVWSVTEGTEAAGVVPLLGPGHITERAAAAIRTAIEAAFQPYAEASGKSRWCDKSLDTVMCPDLIAKIWPDAKFICLYRHVMDVISSGLEACPWGLDGFGFERYSSQYPSNNVAAVGAYWAESTRMIIDFEKKFSGLALRIRYEDLVRDPESVAHSMFSFLGLSDMPGISNLCFTAAHDANGPSDPKIWFTREVSAASVGRGSDVPANRLPPLLRSSINEALAELGYVTVEDDWNSEHRRVGLHISQAEDTEPAPAAADGTIPGDSWEDPNLEAVADQMEVRDKAVTSALLDGITKSWPLLAGRVLGTTLIGDSYGIEEFKWTMPGKPAEGPFDESAQKEIMLSAPAALWRRLLDGTANLWVELHAGRLIVRGQITSVVVRPPEVHAIGVLLGLAQLPATPRVGNNVEALPLA
jgi:hypothetical protein